MARIESQRAVPVALFVLAILLVAARVAVSFTKEDAAKDDLVQWVTPDEAAVLARATDKPFLYDFTAEWCGPCHVLDAEVFRNPQLAEEINARFIPVRVTDRQREEGRNSVTVERLQRRYGVRAFPTVVIASASGTERARMEGYRGRAEFQRMLESVR